MCKCSRYFAFSPLLGIVSFIDLSHSNRLLMAVIFLSLMATGEMDPSVDLATNCSSMPREGILQIYQRNIDR